MKLTCLIILLAPLILFGQQEKKPKSNPERLAFLEYDLNGEEVEPSTVKLPFSSIKIIDSRYDTSIIGFVQKSDPLDGKTNLFRKLHLTGGCANAVEVFLQSLFQHSFDSSGMNLMIVIKKLWLSGIQADKKKDLDVSADFNSTKSLYCKWEYYLAKDGKYLPVKRVDTVFTLADNVDQRVKFKFGRQQKDFLKQSLQQLVEMLDFSKGVQVFGQQNKKSLSEIVNHNEARFKIPILDNNGFAKGVFVNFDEFRNNKPSISNFTEKKKPTDVFHNQKFIEDENGKQINPYWAYFDGVNTRYGKYDNDILYRTGNTFTFFYKMVWYIIDNSPGSFSHKHRIEVWVPYEIDMDTGEIY